MHNVVRGCAEILPNYSFRSLCGLRRFHILFRLAQFVSRTSYRTKYFENNIPADRRVLGSNVLGASAFPRK